MTACQGERTPFLQKRMVLDLVFSSGAAGLELESGEGGVCGAEGPQQSLIL